MWICSFPLNYGIYDLHGFRGWRHVEIDDVFEHYLTVSRFWFSLAVSVFSISSSTTHCTKFGAAGHKFATWYAWQTSKSLLQWMRELHGYLLMLPYNRRSYANFQYLVSTRTQQNVSHNFKSCLWWYRQLGIDNLSLTFSTGTKPWLRTLFWNSVRGSLKERQISVAIANLTHPLTLRVCSKV